MDQIVKNIVHAKQLQIQRMNIKNMIIIKTVL